jgi:hypothetical protein
MTKRASYEANEMEQPVHSHIRKQLSALVAAAEKGANYEEQLLDILKEKKSEDTDEDKSLMLSLVPGLKK